MRRHETPWAPLALALAIGGAAERTAAAEPAPPMPHTVLARVNDKTITSRDVLRQARDRREELRRQGAPDMDRRLFEGWLEARRELVEEFLLVAAGEKLAKDRPLVADFIRGQVRQEVERQRLAYGGEGKLRDYIEKKMKLTYREYLAKLRRKQISRFILHRDVYDGVTVRPSELRDLYQKRIARYRTPGKARYAQILLRIEEEKDRPDRRKLAQELVRRIRGGETFETVAAAFSDDATLDAGPAARTHEKPLNVMSAAIRKVALGLRPGQVSDPVETPSAIRIIKLIELRQGEVKSFESVQGKLREELTMVKHGRKYKALMAKLREVNYVWEKELTPP